MRRQAFLGRRAFLGASAASLFWQGRAFAQTNRPMQGLVMGNIDYKPGIGPLRNAVRDAELIGDALRQCGFELPDEAIVRNGDRNAMLDAVFSYAERLSAAGEEAIGFFYYSGHGAARPGVSNYLIPVLPYEEMSERVWLDSVELNWLFDRLGAHPGPQVLSIDACRNQLRLPVSPGVLQGGFANAKGLQVAASKPPSMYISYATWDGATASDGAADDTHGPYAKVLAAHLLEGGRTVRDMFAYVQDDVRQLTANRQEPMGISRLARKDLELALPSPQQHSLSDPADKTRAPRPRKTLSHALVVSCAHAGTPFALPHTSHDGDLVAEALAKSGFEVNRLIDPDRQSVLAGISDLSERVASGAGAGVGVVYFAGYGRQAGGTNYLIAGGGVPQSRFQLQTDGVPLRAVIEGLEATPSSGIVLLLDTMRSLAVGTSRDIPRGLGKEFGSENVTLAYATQPGRTAIDGPEGSYFAAALHRVILNADRVPVHLALDKVRLNVQEATNGRNTPFYATTQKLPIYFRDGTAVG